MHAHTRVPGYNEIVCMGLIMHTTQQTLNKHMARTSHGCLK